MLFLAIKLRSSMSRIMLSTYQLYLLDFIFFSVHIKRGVRGKHGELEKKGSWPVFISETKLKTCN